mmetsp:Transcript_6780/g.15417  ORF Transcript_6780/g.15417 Transcript_6780/m.15417 type:complete len:103 (-) Transcript_6780:99-407(-)|eukprot:CAMPEP_0197895962 /NCGR_PEP_ID=MMETSP1439-20131203/38594_1 /TAXON_ID=66791 /ORGANISM="Gonyaulax spinifera, Strain CCMP409" /LENGTH=102 /DNA_ID=CAMNT_0043516431 /DNA_START=78 /DNA_END=386 /DNA_ORIENTATION=+
MADQRDFVLEALAGLAAWSTDPANADGVAECKAMAAADTSEGKIEAKKGVLARMVRVRCEEKPDSRLAAFKDDVTPLWEMLLACRDDPEVDKAYAQVAVILG